jgi:hypothetical protein
MVPSEGRRTLTPMSGKKPVVGAGVRSTLLPRYVDSAQGIAAEIAAHLIVSKGI